MNKLLQYGLPGPVALTMAMPAMARSGYNGHQMGANGNCRNNSERTGQWSGQRRQAAGNGRNNGQGHGQDSNQAYNQNLGQNGGNGEAVTLRFVAHLQCRLRQDGLYRQGNIDGVWGPGTQTALEQFQHQNGLRPTGQIDLRTLEALNMLNGGTGGAFGANGRNRPNNNQESGPTTYNNDNISGHDFSSDGSTATVTGTSDTTL